MKEMLNRAGSLRLSFLLLFTVSGLLYYASLSPKQFGYPHDDSIYVTTAKALATGEGYRIISLPYEPAQTKYPPFFPFLLSLVWRVFPDFPKNLIPMMLLNVAVTLAFLAVSYRYIARQGYAASQVALVASGLAAFNWRTVALGTSLYSEMVYALLSVLSLYLADEYEKHEGFTRGALTGLLIGLTFLTRSLGVTLLIALAFYYVLRKQWKKALIPVAVGSLFVIVWLVWCLVNKTAVDGANVAYYTSYFGHINQVVTSLHDQNNMPKWLVFLGLWVKNMLGFSLMSPVVVLIGIDFSAAQYFGFASIFPLAGFIRQARTRLRLLHIYILCYLAMAAVVPFPSYDRYLIPLLPFVLVFMIAEAQRWTALIRNKLKKNERVTTQFSAGVIGLALLISAGTGLYNHFSEIYVRVSQEPFQKTAKPAPEDAETIEWVNEHTSASDGLVCYHDPVYFLYTGRKSSRSLPMGDWVDWRAPGTSPEAVENSILRTVEKDGPHFLVVTPSDFGAEDQTGQYQKIFDSVVASHPERFTLVFSSKDGQSRIYRLEKNDENSVE